MRTSFILGILVGALLALASLASPAHSQEIDVSQVKGLPQQLQALVDQINTAVARLDARINTIALTPGPKGDKGDPGPAGQDGKDVEASVVDELRAVIALKADAIPVRDANGQLVGDVVGLQADVAGGAPTRWWVLRPNGIVAQVTFNSGTLRFPVEGDVYFTQVDCAGDPYMAANATQAASREGSIWKLYEPAGAPLTINKVSYRAAGADACANQPAHAPDFITAAPARLVETLIGPFAVGQ